MVTSGKLEHTPLQEVLQVIAYSGRSGILSVNGPTGSGSVVFQDGNIITTYTASTRSLMERAAGETDARNRFGLRRIQILAALAEMLDLREGLYHFTASTSPVGELEGVSVAPFYESGALDTGDLLLGLERAMATEPPPPAPAQNDTDPASNKRRHPRYGPVMMKAILTKGGTTFSGFLTNLSVGGAFFQTEELPQMDMVYDLKFILPQKLGPCQAHAKVVWANVHVADSKRGVGLSFEQMPIDSLQRLTAYIDRFQELASDMEPEA
jgi:Tfp pilus assembly protein PilZ